MSPLSARRAAFPAEINGQTIQVEGGESLLQAALRQGIDFPYSCRVGGCGTCKCRLIEGEVKERTETGYLLTAEELAAGTILACQSVPRGKVKISVDLSRPSARQVLRGRVVGQHKLTGDITRLDVQLEESMPYKAGQYAQVSMAGLPA
ncbi:MAG TPA: 2Fe-2S iron-sulfur cluster-binding protein, partial [Myxococcota bacterium]|nr:2Fe-2S iron-sulfur cluster-binding protein [Myxococcota bacterium]